MYVNPRTGKSWTLERALWRAPDDDLHLNLELFGGLSLEDIDRQERSIWRYRKAFRQMPENFYSLGEGLTPLLKSDWNSSSVFFKLEYFAPSGSFKDRGICVLLNYLKARGINRIIEDSSGNAGSSIAMYSAFMDIDCKVVCPALAPIPKLEQIAAFGVEVETVEGSRDDVAEHAISQTDHRFYASHSWQPFFLEGTKTIAYEIWEQLDGQVPDCFVAPLGQGGNILGAFIGFCELKKAGQLERIPRIYGVQAKNCAPFFNEAKEIEDNRTKGTIADGIASAKPVRLREVLDAFAESDGDVVAVEEEEIVTEMKKLHRRGFFVEPTCATATAGFNQLVSKGMIKETDKTVIVLTGSGLKAIDVISRLV